jgi:D-alanyl-D-alanine carboxypeptidase
VDLDAPISRYLPGDLGVDLNGATVRQVLGHQSGIGEHTLEPSFLTEVARDPLRRWKPREVLAYAEGPQFAPGSEFRYSNTNYVLLGLLVEHVTGRPFGDVLREEILDPLRLPAFVYQPDEAPQGELAVGLTTYPDTTGALQPISGGGLVPTLALATAAGSAGGIAADAISLAQWGRALFDGHVLSDASLAAMLDFDHPDGVPYGLGVMQVEPAKGQKVVGHNGGIPGFSSALLHDRDRDITVAVLVARDLAQGQDPTVLAEMFLQAASAPGG